MKAPSTVSHFGATAQSMNNAIRPGMPTGQIGPSGSMHSAVVVKNSDRIRAISRMTSLLKKEKEYLLVTLIKCQSKMQFIYMKALILVAEKDSGWSIENFATAIPKTSPASDSNWDVNEWSTVHFNIGKFIDSLLPEGSGSGKRADLAPLLESLKAEMSDTVRRIGVIDAALSLSFEISRQVDEI